MEIEAMGFLLDLLLSSGLHAELKSPGATGVYWSCIVSEWIA